MNEEIKGVVANAEFYDDLNSNLHVNYDYESKDYNYRWLELFEEVIPYINNILKNPKKFIVNEEDIVKVEKSKKVTVESVIHLTQHTNLIQKFDPKKGEVRPSKVLNINKEESLDTYENRFVFTLIGHMQMFYNNHAKNLGDDAFYRNKKHLVYNGNTKIGTETVRVSIDLDSFDESFKKASQEPGMSVADRLKKVKLQLDGFGAADLCQTLTRLHVPEVRSPIRKTNAILKNPNFQKAVELWNFIQSFNGEDLIEEKDKRDYMDAGEVRGKFDETFVMSYLAASTFNKNRNEVSEKQMISLAISRVIENILDMNDEVLEDKLKEVFSKEYKSAKDKIDNRNDRIRSIFEDKFEKEDAILDEALKLLV